MKKLLLSALAVLAFVGYAVFQRETGAATGTLIGPGTGTTAAGAGGGPRRTTTASTWVMSPFRRGETAAAKRVI